VILLISPKSAYATARLLEEAKKSGTVIVHMTMAELEAKDFNIDPEPFDSLFIRSPFIGGLPEFFPQIVALAQKFKSAGKKVVDGVIAEGELGQGKMADYQRLEAAGVAIPKTVWFSQAGQWQYPCIAKWTYGYGGKEVFLINSADDLYKSVEFIPTEELLLQEFVPAECEYKVMTVGYKSLPVVLKFKTNPKIFRPDFGETEVITLPAPDPKINQLIQVAELAAKTLCRELSKIDILESKGKFYVLEVNRWPGLKSFEELTGYNVAGEFLGYVRCKI